MDNKNNDIVNQQLQKELTDLQERFVSSENLASIGKLSAGILHEIRNPINFISNFTKLSQELVRELAEKMDEFKADDKEDIAEISEMLTENLQKILDNSDRVQRIIASILAQTRSDYESIFEPTDINQLVEEFVKLAYHGVRGNDKDFNVSIQYNFDETIGKQNVGAHELSRVILNIINNACYAIKEKVKQNLGFNPTIIIQTILNKDSFDIIIEDNGTGIPQSVIDKLFTPFFTTKPIGQGTGLGLSLSKEIIEIMHKGSIQIYSEVGKFTKFIIRIPK